MKLILLSQLDLEDEPPPLPPRKYSWSEVEDQSSDENDELPAPMHSLKLASLWLFHTDACVLAELLENVQFIEALI